MDRLGHFIEGFGSRFDNVNRQTLDSIASYIHGLLSEARRKNIERIAEQKPTSNYQNIQYAVSEAQWDHRQTIDGVAQQANRFGSPSDWLGLNQRIPKKSGSVRVVFVTDDQGVMGSDSAQHLSENHRPDLHQS
jgi:SRSO17 transposase